MLFSGLLRNECYFQDYYIWDFYVILNSGFLLQDYFAQEEFVAPSILQNVGEMMHSHRLGLGRARAFTK